MLIDLRPSDVPIGQVRLRHRAVILGQHRHRRQEVINGHRVGLITIARQIASIDLLVVLRAEQPRVELHADEEREEGCQKDRAHATQQSTVPCLLLVAELHAMTKLILASKNIDTTSGHFYFVS